MTIVADFQAALRAISPPVFKAVAGAAEFASIDNAPKTAPIAFVMIEEEVSGENNRAMGGPVLQRCEADVAVVIVTSNVSDATGAAGAADIERFKIAVRSALIGLVPSSSEDGTPVEHVSGNLIRARSGWIWQREVFSAAYYLGEDA